MQKNFLAAHISRCKRLVTKVQCPFSSRLFCITQAYLSQAKFTLIIVEADFDKGDAGSDSCAATARASVNRSVSGSLFGDAGVLLKSWMTVVFKRKKSQPWIHDRGKQEVGKAGKWSALPHRSALWEKFIPNPRFARRVQTAREK